MSRRQHVDDPLVGEVVVGAERVVGTALQQREEQQRADRTSNGYVAVDVRQARRRRSAGWPHRSVAAAPRAPDGATPPGAGLERRLGTAGAARGTPRATPRSACPSSSASIASTKRPASSSSRAMQSSASITSRSRLVVEVPVEGAATGSRGLEHVLHAAWMEPSDGEGLGAGVEDALDDRRDRLAVRRRSPAPPTHVGRRPCTVSAWSLAASPPES